MRIVKVFGEPFLKRSGDTRVSSATTAARDKSRQRYLISFVFVPGAGPNTPQRTVRKSSSSSSRRSKTQWSLEYLGDFEVDSNVPNILCRARRPHHPHNIPLVILGRSVLPASCVSTTFTT